MSGEIVLTADRALAFHLVPRPVPRPWGGERVAARFGWSAHGACGEWWLASSYPGTETTLRGHSHDLADWLDGPGRARGLPGAEHFPLLVKFLDAQDVLSLQVHPNDDVAVKHGLPNGKTEAWHVVEAEQGAAVYLGCAPGVSCVELLDAIEGGASDGEVRTLLNRVEVRPGDTIHVDAGTIHAIGPGLVLYEVQQNSDATYRIHDWGRGREVHLAQTRDAMIDHPAQAPLRVDVGAGELVTLIDGPAFRLHRGRVEGALDIATGARFSTLTVLAGSGVLHADGARSRVKPGDTLITLGAVRLEGTGLDVLVAEAPTS
ncbi:MAG: mannose-6-phosphate isomerase [Planctomycetota bacterium]|nr:MAG: mannose-6-phosphate isomerase [Planctomycetota bacterium]